MIMLARLKKDLIHLLYKWVVLQNPVEFTNIPRKMENTLWWTIDKVQSDKEGRVLNVKSHNWENRRESTKTISQELAPLLFK